MGAIGRSGAVGLGVLLILAVLAFVADADDPEAFSSGPARPALGPGHRPSSGPPASIARAAVEPVTATDPRGPPRA